MANIRGSEVIGILTKEVSDHQKKMKTTIEKLTILENNEKYQSPVCFQWRFTGEMKESNW